MQHLLTLLPLISIKLGGILQIFNNQKCWRALVNNSSEKIALYVTFEVLQF